MIDSSAILHFARDPRLMLGLYRVYQRVTRLSDSLDVDAGMFRAIDHVLEVVGNQVKAEQSASGGGSGGTTSHWL